MGSRMAGGERPERQVIVDDSLIERYGLHFGFGAMVQPQQFGAQQKLAQGEGPPSEDR